MSVVTLGPDHVVALTRFFAELPDGDLTFIKEDVLDPEAVHAWLGAPGQRWVATDGGAVTGFLAVRPLPGWSDHVGEIRLVVHPARRGSGLGRELARHALVCSVEAGLSKLVVEVVADQVSAIALFTALGFTGEALLQNHIRDREGRRHDLMILAHHVDDTRSAMETLGLPEALAS